MKVWAYLALAVVLIGAASAGYSAIYKAGFNSAVTEQQQLAIIAQNDAIKKARAEWELSAKAGQVEVIIEERIVEVVREIIKEIPVIVERIVEVTPECADLGSDFLRVYNDAIRAGDHTGADPAPAAGDTDDALPSA